jgi:hypothetical protein
MILEQFYKFTWKWRTLWGKAECDYCHKCFEKRLYGLRSKHHFCCKQCSGMAKRRGAISYDPVLLAEAQRKSRETSQKRYGVSHPFQLKSIQEKRKQTWIENYGTTHPWKSKEIQEKCKQTWIENYGVDNPSKSNVVLAKFDQADLHHKGHITKKKNGTYGKSKIEDQFYEELCRYFGNENVERQVIVNDWSIDFQLKIEQCLLYMQFDGGYYHGHDREYAVIAECKHKIDKVILGVIERDKKQNEWFPANDLHFVRISEKTFKDFLKKNKEMNEKRKESFIALCYIKI